MPDILAIALANPDVGVPDDALATAPRKYRNKPVEIDGIHFDSQKEARRWRLLKQLQAAGEISNLELQPRYEILPGFVDANGKRHRATHYVADFSYWEKDHLVVEDVKGAHQTVTPLFRLKMKMLLYRYAGIDFRIVT